MNRATMAKQPPKTAERHMMAFYPNEGRPIFAKTVGRNQPCECGSGKKQKHCCGTKTRYFTPKSKP